MKSRHSVPGGSSRQDESLGELFTDRHFTICFAFAVTVRLVVFLVIIWFPLRNEKAILTSPLHYQTGTDFPVFEDARKALFDSNLGQLLDNLWGLSYNSKTLNSINRPVFPTLLQITGYAPGNTLPLAIVYLCISVIWVSVWMIWLRRRDMGLLWIALFSLLPVPIWFTISLSTDLLFAAIVAGFWLTFERGKFIWTTIFLILGVLTRPNGLSLALFLASYFALIHETLRVRTRLAIIFVCGALGIGALTFLRNDLYVFAVTTDYKAYFGYSQSQLLSGIYDQLPLWIDIPLSWFSLLGVKMMFFVGIRPSFSDASLIMVLIRSAAGLILLPGLLWSFIAGQKQLRLFLLCFMLPIFMGLAQERYMLPILPILYFYGVMALQVAWRPIGNKFEFGVPKNLD